VQGLLRFPTLMGFLQPSRLMAHYYPSEITRTKFDAFNPLLELERKKTKLNWPRRWPLAEAIVTIWPTDSQSLSQLIISL